MDVVHQADGEQWVQAADTLLASQIVTEAMSRGWISRIGRRTCTCRRRVKMPRSYFNLLVILCLKTSKMISVLHAVYQSLKVQSGTFSPAFQLLPNRLGLQLHSKGKTASDCCKSVWHLDFFHRSNQVSDPRHSLDSFSISWNVSCLNLPVFEWHFNHFGCANPSPDSPFGLRQIWLQLGLAALKHSCL